MVVTTTLRDLLLATWALPPSALARKLPRGLELETTASGEALVSLVGTRATNGRTGVTPVPAYSQLTVRTYVVGEAGPAVFFLGLRVTPGALGAIAFGIPVRVARILVGDGLVTAKALGLSLRYRRLGPAADVPALPSGALGHHDVAYFYAAGVRRLTTTHEPFRWEAAELVERPSLEPLLALGLDVGEPDSLLYAARTRFEVRLPPANVGGSAA